MIAPVALSSLLLFPVHRRPTCQSFMFSSRFNNERCPRFGFRKTTLSIFPCPHHLIVIRATTQASRWPHATMDVSAFEAHTEDEVTLKELFDQLPDSVKAVVR